MVRPTTPRQWQDERSSTPPPPQGRAPAVWQPYAAVKQAILSLDRTSEYRTNTHIVLASTIRLSQPYWFSHVILAIAASTATGTAHIGSGYCLWTTCDPQGSRQHQPQQYCKDSLRVPHGHALQLQQPHVPLSCQRISSHTESANLSLFF